MGHPHDAPVPKPLLPAPLETTPLPAWSAMSPALWAALFDPASWRESLEVYAHSTHLAVALVDAAGHLLGPCLNPQPTWQHLHTHLGATGRGCPFALAPYAPCTCVQDALTQRDLVFMRERTGLVHFTVPLVLDDQPVGALLAGQVFDQYPEQFLLEHVATRCGLSPQAVWHIARREVPVTRATVRLYGRLLSVLSQAFLQARYHSLLDAQRLAALEQRVQRRTATLATVNAALQQEIAERTQVEASRRALLQRLITAQEDERRRIARELHDSLGQFLSAHALTLAVVQAADGCPPAVRTGLARLQEAARTIDVELDRLTRELRPPALDDLGLDDALHRYVEEWTSTSAIAGEVRTIGFDTTRLPIAVEASAYRIVQEALTNVLKHAQAHHVSVIAERRADMLRVLVEDDGVGFDLEAVRHEQHSRRHLGLVGMAERATLAGGTATVESIPGGGTTVYLHIPLSSANQEHRGDSHGGSARDACG